MIIIFYLMVVIAVCMLFYAFRGYIFRGEKNMRKIIKNKEAGVFLGVLFILCCFIMGATFVHILLTDYEINRDIDGYLDRAQVASDPVDMKDYLVKCAEGMDEWGLTDGHATLWFPTPENDMRLVVKALHRSINRCIGISHMNDSSPEYQTALDDVRGQIRELNLHSHERYWVINWYVQAFGIWFMFLLVVLFGFLAFAVVH